jgi:hypothetical protein
MHEVASSRLNPKLSIVIISVTTIHPTIPPAPGNP